MAFAHLHLHTMYSLQDAMIRPRELAKRIKELGMTHVAVTDHGTMSGIPDVYTACKKEGIVPVLGLETYVAPRFNTDKEAHIDNANYHLVLLCENEIGYHNLMKLASDASCNGFYYRPRTDKKHLSMYHEGLICLSACMAGEVQRLILADKYEEAVFTAKEYEDIFGKGNFYLEMQDHALPEDEKINSTLRKISQETGIPLVVTNDCHYIHRENAESHDVLMAIQAKTTVFDDKRKAYGSSEFYVKTEQEMRELFPNDLEAIENTQKIAERCHVEIDYGSQKLPPFAVPKHLHMTNDEMFDSIVWSGAKKRYGENLPQVVIDRINYEVSVIRKMGFVNYFLIVFDMVRFCREGTDNYGDPPNLDWEEIPVGPGRGSAAGSIVSYCMGITHVDPIKNNLLFERFLSVDRVSLPDIDEDYSDDRREEVIRFCERKYGRDCVCQIVTFSTMAARAAVRNVARALGISLSKTDAIAKMIPQELGMTISDAIEVNSELKSAYEGDQEVSHLLDLSMALEGIPIHCSVHAAGVLITDKKGVDYYGPIMLNEKGGVSIAYDKHYVEEANLLKIDVLGLKNLGQIAQTIKAIKRNHGVEITLDKLYACDDDAVYSLFAEGKTAGIFQCEGAGMTNLLVRAQPTCFDDIAAAIALYRWRNTGR